MDVRHAQGPGTIAEVTSLFQQPWWLEAVAPGTWSAVEIREGGTLQARLPYVRERRLGLTLLRQPPLTQVLGPWLRPVEGPSATQFAHHMALATALIAQWPAHDYFAQCFHYSVENWLPFYRQGCQQTTCYTYVIENLTDLDHVFASFQRHLRYDIRKAHQQLRVHSEYGLDTLLTLIARTFARQGLPLPYSRAVVHRLDAACTAHAARQILFAEDASGRVHAGAYIVWDERSAYYLMGGGDPELRMSGAASLVLWEAIQCASHVAPRFDFEGSMVAPIEHFFRAFGARQMPYFSVRRCSRRMRVLLAARDVLRAVAGH